MTISTQSTPSRERLLELIDELWDGWNWFLHRDPNQLCRPRDTEHPLTTAVVMALASQVTETARSVAALVRAEMSDLTLLPLVRTAYETAITAHWLAKVPDATAAFINEDARTRRALIQDLPKARSPTFRESVDSIRRQIVPEQPTSSAAPARHFKEMCNDFEVAGMDAYIYYRAACALVHPSVLVADQYLEQDGDGVIVHGAASHQGDAWIFLATASMVWGQMAANYCDPARTRRSDLRRIGRELGISAHLELSEAAYQRLADEKQSRQKAGVTRS